MRISIPSIPATSTRETIEYTIERGAEILATFLDKGKGKALLMTGAGASVDSGIAPYRGENGHYTVHKTYRPIFYHEFLDASPKGHVARQRYWSRSFLGYPPVLHAQPNKTHYAVAALQRMGYFGDYITQNVDSLHHTATPSPSLAASSILELHGTLKNVVCVSSPEHHKHSSSPLSPSQHSLLTVSHLSGPRYAAPVPWNTPTGEAYPNGCGFRGSRAVYQEMLAQRNPRWHKLATDMHESGVKPKTNPDGDVDLGNADYSSFSYEPCPNCGGILKPAVVFFGENVPAALRDRSHELVRESSSMLLVGTSLATYSAYRLVREAIESGKPGLILNKGPTRADALDIDKVELGSSQVLHAAALLLAGSRADKDPVLRRLLDSGVMIEPNERMRGVISS